jgi:hypothetical protein
VRRCDVDFVIDLTLTASLFVFLAVNMVFKFGSERERAYKNMDVDF